MEYIAQAVALKYVIGRLQIYVTSGSSLLIESNVKTVKRSRGGGAKTMHTRM